MCALIYTYITVFKYDLGAELALPACAQKELDTQRSYWLSKSSGRLTMFQQGPDAVGASCKRNEFTFCSARLSGISRNSEDFVSRMKLHHYMFIY